MVSPHSRVFGSLVLDTVAAPLYPLGSRETLSRERRAVFLGVAGEEPPRLPEPPVTTELGLEAIKRTIQLHSKHWPILVDTAAERAQPSGFGMFRNFFRMVRGHEPDDDEERAGGRASGGGGTDVSDSDGSGGHDASGGEDGAGEEPERGGGNGNDHEDADGDDGDDGDDDGKFATPRATSDELPGEAAGQQGEEVREQADGTGADGADVRSERPGGGDGAQREAGGPLAASKGIGKGKEGLSLAPATLAAIVAQDAADQEEAKKSS